MRNRFDKQLSLLNKELIQMGAMCEEAITLVTKALMIGDEKIAHKVSSTDSGIDQMERDIESLCLKLLLQQQPVAGDLRQISAALKMITDMERIGDHGTDISELTVLMGKKPYPDEIRMIEEMSKEAMVMLMEAVDAFAQADAKKAGAVIEMDDIVDELFLKIKGAVALSVKTSETDAEQELDLLMTAKYFERIGDHATNIAEWVLFGITGELPED